MQWRLEHSAERLAAWPPGEAEQRPRSEQQGRDENRLAQQLLELTRAQAQCDQCRDAEQPVEQLVMKASTRQKEQRAQEQEITGGEYPQANEIENSIGRTAEAAKLHAVRFIPEVDRPFE